MIIWFLWKLYSALKRKGAAERPEKRDSDDPYEILGVPRGASAGRIKAAYREKIKEYHPDKFYGQPDWIKKQAEEMTQKINRAYDIINQK